MTINKKQVQFDRSEIGKTIFISERANKVPAGCFEVSLDELRRQMQQGKLEAGSEGLQKKPFLSSSATKVPEGTFHVSLDELRNQVRSGKLEAGPNGLSESQQKTGSATKVPKGTFHCVKVIHSAQLPVSKDVRPYLEFHEIDDAKVKTSEMDLPFKGATKVPPGTFHGLLNDPIAQFKRDAPQAVYMGAGPDGELWVETVVDPVTGLSVKLAYTTEDQGKTAAAWCLEPDMKGHTENVHNCHCYSSGEVCTDQHGVIRNLPEKRARALLWVTGFANYLKTGNFAIDRT